MTRQFESQWTATKAALLEGMDLISMPDNPSKALALTRGTEIDRVIAAAAEIISAPIIRRKSDAIREIFADRDPVLTTSVDHVGDNRAARRRRAAERRRDG